MFYQTLHIAANRINFPIAAANHTRILPIRRVALDGKSLPKSEFARFHYVGLVPFFHNDNWCAFANHPEVFASHVQACAACGALAAPAWGHGSSERFVGHVLQIEAVAAVELVGRVNETS